MWTSGGPFLWVCEELISLGPHLRSACNITFRNWKHVCSGICKICLCIWGRGLYFNINFICLLGMCFVWSSCYCKYTWIFFKWQMAHASLCILMTPLPIYHGRISIYCSVIFGGDVRVLLIYLNKVLEIFRVASCCSFLLKNGIYFLVIKQVFTHWCHNLCYISFWISYFSCTFNTPCANLNLRALHDLT